jgi:hypothetical protein
VASARGVDAFKVRLLWVKDQPGPRWSVWLSLRPGEDRPFDEMFGRNAWRGKAEIATVTARTAALGDRAASHRDRLTCRDDAGSR